MRWKELGHVYLNVQQIINSVEQSVTRGFYMTFEIESGSRVILFTYKKYASLSNLSKKHKQKRIQRITIKFCFI